MKIAVASGKGGTGKTLLAVNLAVAAARKVTLVDCDVEAPNARLFLGGVPDRKRTVAVAVAVIDPARCDGCGRCAAFCQFHALVSFGLQPVLLAELCRGCGGCRRVCPRKAITEAARPLGVVETFAAGNIRLVEGRTDVGTVFSTPVIRAAKQVAGDGLMLLDAPPGTACPLVETVRDADAVLLVAEPTPFGLNDLMLAVAVVRALGLRFGVVVNRADGDPCVRDFCRGAGIPVLAEIPDDRRIAEACAAARPIVETLPEYRRTFANLLAAACAPGGAS